MALFLSSTRSLREQQIHQITGTRYPVFVVLLKKYREACKGGRGRPPKHGSFVELVVALLTLRHDLTLRAVEVLPGLDHVTIMRMRPSGRRPR